MTSVGTTGPTAAGGAPAGTGALAWLGPLARRRAQDGLHRVLQPRAAGPDPLLDLAGNDYLALSRHPDVVSGAVQALREHGAGATGSRLVTGSTCLHQDLETALAAFVGCAGALVFSSGYLANLGAVTALAGPDTLVVSDADNHASLVDACRLARARRVVVTPHGDVAAVDHALRDRSEPRALVLTDAVFSVDGGAAPLAGLHAAARAAGAVLLVDEAHGLGVTGGGRGSSAAAGLAGEPDVVLTLTLSKSLGSQGGAVLGPALLRDHLVDTARSFVFDTGLAPAAAGAALAALRLVTPERVRRLRAVADRLADAVGVPRTDGAVVRVPVGDAHRAEAARDACAREGLRVGCFRPPSVQAGSSCLRLTARPDLTDEQVDRAADVVRRAVTG